LFGVAMNTKGPTKNGKQEGEKDDLKREGLSSPARRGNILSWAFSQEETIYRKSEGGNWIKEKRDAVVEEKQRHTK